MIAMKQVLVPTDFSDASDAALRYGIALARAFHAKLHLLHIPEHPRAMAAAEYPIGLVAALRNADHERLGQLLTEQEYRELLPERAMRIGTPCDEIVGYAGEHDIDLIVMGTHGRRGIARVLMGSVAEHVVRTAPCPVLTVRGPQYQSVQVAERVALRAEAAT
jgi:nucleotide-binding universal stress UspA family protein